MTTRRWRSFVITVWLGALIAARGWAADPAPPSQEEREKAFKETMANVVMAGHWSPVKDGVLGEERADKYTIVSVEKTTGTSWVVKAKMNFGGRELVVPIPVQVRWAGDTPMIIVQHLQMPGQDYASATFSARVLIYNHTYAGSWTAGDHGGLLSGVIEADKSAIAAPAQ